MAVGVAVGVGVGVAVGEGVGVAVAVGVGVAVAVGVAFAPLAVGVRAALHVAPVGAAVGAGVGVAVAAGVAAGGASSPPSQPMSAAAASPAPPIAPPRRTVRRVRRVFSPSNRMRPPSAIPLASLGVRCSRCDGNIFVLADLGLPGRARDAGRASPSRLSSCAARSGGALSALTMRGPLRLRLDSGFRRNDGEGGEGSGGSPPQERRAAGKRSRGVGVTPPSPLTPTLSPRRGGRNPRRLRHGWRSPEVGGRSPRGTRAHACKAPHHHACLR